MAQYGGQNGTGQTDEHRNHNMQHNGGNMIGSDYETRNVGSEYGAGTGGGGHDQNQHQHHSLSEMLQRSGSSTFSDDEAQEAGRKKKGLTEKIKEKIPGIGNKEQSSQNTTTTTATTTGTATGGGGYEQHHEKKGLMDKIKDKLPGSH